MRSSIARNKQLATVITAFGLIALGFGVFELKEGIRIGKEATSISQEWQETLAQNRMLLMQANKAEAMVKGAPMLEAKDLSTVVPLSVQWLHQAGQRYGIRYSSFTITHGKVFGGNYNQLGYPIKKLGKPLPRFRGLSVEDVQVSGNWSSLIGLIGYLRSVEAKHIAIRTLTISKSYFDATLGIVGKS